jgi:hypothetical protein
VSGYWEAPNDYQFEPQTFQGSAHSVSSDKAAESALEALLNAVEEVTGSPVARPERKIGFI